MGYLFSTKQNSFSAAIRVLVDGGANQWFNYITANKLDGLMEPPQFLTGDMDSISTESSDRLKVLNCQIIPTPDQSETDCTKSLIAIQSHAQTLKVSKSMKSNSSFLFFSSISNLFVLHFFPIQRLNMSFF